MLTVSHVALCLHAALRALRPTNPQARVEIGFVMNSLPPMSIHGCLGKLVCVCVSLSDGGMGPTGCYWYRGYPLESPILRIQELQSTMVL